MTPEEKAQLKRYLKGGGRTTPEEQQRMAELMKANAGNLQTPDAADEPVADPELGVLFAKVLGFKLWILPDRAPMPAWMIRLERRSTKVLVPFLAVFALLSQIQMFAFPVGILLFLFSDWVGLPSAKDFDAIQAATPSVGIISLIDFSFVGLIGLIGFYWMVGTVPPKRIRFLYGSFLFPSLLAVFGMIFMAAPQRSRSGIFLISHFLDRSASNEELFDVIEDFTRDKMLICKSTFTCTVRKFRIARVSAPNDTWEVGVEQLSKLTRRDLRVLPPFRIWGRVRHGIPGVPTLDIRSVRLDGSIHGYFGREKYSYPDLKKGQLAVGWKPSRVDQLKGKFVVFVYLPEMWPKPEAKEIMDWLKAVDDGGQSRVAELSTPFAMNFGGEPLYDNNEASPFLHVNVNANLSRACKFIAEDQEDVYGDLSHREPDEKALGLFGLCLLNKEGYPVFQGDLRKLEDRAEAIRRINTARQDPAIQPAN